MLMQGATAYLGIVLKKKTGPINLTGAKVEFLARLNEFGDVATKLCTIEDESEGSISVMLSPEDTREAGTLYYQLKITFPDNTICKSELVSLYIEESLPEPATL